MKKARRINLWHALAGRRHCSALDRWRWPVAPLGYAPEPTSPQAPISGNLDKKRHGALRAQPETLADRCGGQVHRRVEKRPRRAVGQRSWPARARCATACRRSLDRHILAWAIALQGGERCAERRDRRSRAGAAGLAGHGDTCAATAKAPAPREPCPDSRGARLRRHASRKQRKARSSWRVATSRSGNCRGARAVLSPFWRTEKLEAEDEAAIIKEFGALIPAADHRFRMERMLYADRVISAQRVAALAGAKPLPMPGRPSSRATRTPASCSTRCRQPSVPPAICSPRPDICGATRSLPSRRGHAEGADATRRRWSIPTPGGSSGGCCRANWSTPAT